MHSTANIPTEIRFKELKRPMTVRWPLRLRHWQSGTSSDGRVVRASASGAVDLGLIPSRVKPMTLKLVFAASQLDVPHSAVKGQCEEQAGKFTCCAVGKGTKWYSPILVW